MLSCFFEVNFKKRFRPLLIKHEISYNSIDPKNQKKTLKRAKNSKLSQNNLI